MEKSLNKEESNRQFQLGYHLAFTNSAKRKNWSNIFALWYSAARYGHARAQFYLGTCYDHGLGVEKNIKNAFTWYLKAAKQGHMESQYNIGFFFREGELVKQDFKKAVNWFTMAANQGDTEAQRDLGYCYFYGNGVKEDHRTAVYWYKRAAAKDNPMALYNLGLCHKHGHGVRQSVRWARYYFEKAEKLGYKNRFTCCHERIILLSLRQMFIDDDTRKRLIDIVKGIVLEGKTDTCTATRNLLCSSFRTSTTVKKNFEDQSRIKKEQAEFLKHHSTLKNNWLKDLPDENYFLTRGGEAKIYFSPDQQSVIKLNDGIYYATWLEFFNSIVIHNLLFEESAYTFLGFAEKDDSLLAVLKQPFISSDAPVDIEDVKKLLAFNGFVNTKRNDYFNKELGLILEDMHDENIIVNSNTLFFIDTVFYTVSE